MDIFDEEILKFWSALQKYNVQYIMIGGYATNLSGYHINQLIENKKVINRPKDQIDVLALEQISKLRESQDQQ